MESVVPPTKLPGIALHGSTAEEPRSERDLLKDSIWSISNYGGEGSNQIAGIGLRLGSSSTKCGFTFLQMQELKHQTLIYKYMEAGIPVPFNLVLPIWKSMSSLLSGINVMGCSTTSLYCNYRNNSMEAEPGRCKRTDGKKWRCSKNVVPNHKYCQRHLHRGVRAILPTSRNHIQVLSSISTSNHHQIGNTGVDLSLCYPEPLKNGAT